MKQELARRCLSQLMGWDSERARQEFRWLDLIARLKYDGYRGYFAGARFVESLLDWLQQFDEPAERAVAYGFLRTHLVYVGPAELQHLVELFYPETVRELLASAVAAELSIPKYLVWSRPDGRDAFARLLRHCLFMGISDGARLDTLRRANVGVIRNEQVVPTIEVDDRRWSSLVKDLRESVQDQNAQFRFIFIVDDFTGSGLTLLRKGADGVWDGKLVRLWEALRKRVGTDIASDFTLVVHHYLASAHARQTVPERAASAAVERQADWFPRVLYQFGAVLPADLPISTANAAEFMPLVDRHYNANIMTKSLRVGGDDARLGFASCALPLVLEHNAPNNTVALLWAEVPASDAAPEMRPLFRRRQRHL